MLFRSEAIETGHEIAAMLIGRLAEGRIVRRNVVNPEVLEALEGYTAE